MNTTERAALRKLAEAAEPAPWEYSHNGMMDPPSVYINDYPHITVTSSDADALYIAAANPKVVLALLNRIERLERVAEAARKVNTARPWRGYYETSIETGNHLQEALDALDSEGDKG